MNRPSSSLLLGISIASLGLVGCGSDAPPPSEVRARIATDLVHVLGEAEAATAGGDALPSQAAFTLVDRALGGPLASAFGNDASSGTAFLVQSQLTRLAGAIAPRGDLRASRERAVGELAADETDETTIDFDGEAAAQWLNDNLFTDANHAGDGIYRVPGALVCTETTYDDAGNEIGEAVDPECVQGFAQLQLRIRVSEDDDTLRFAVQLGPDHDEPLVVGLGANSLSLTVDLDETEDAIRALIPAGEGTPSFRLSGEVTASLEILGTASARASLAIDRAISIKVAEDGSSLDGASAFRFASAKATVFAITVDGNAKTSALEVGLGETSAHVPGDVDFGEPTVDLDLSGVTAVATHTAGQPLQLTHVGLGSRTTTLSVDGARAISIDLNPDDGRAFGATLTENPTTGSTMLTVSPKLDLRIGTDHVVLGDEAPVYDVTQVFLDGSLRSSLAQDHVEVVSGTLRLATNPASYGFTAIAGQCVSSQEVVDASDRYYTQWSVGSCL
ncbi:MAG: hypothetical protein H0T89_26990 [Deltaproteobacteria bacterium]|nr:hypothetical protein [Deltaproteobacteria bacterium]MDQ3301147.1 hypothetical protein [Myxococcota bacterium]